MLRSLLCADRGFACFRKGSVQKYVLYMLIKFAPWDFERVESVLEWRHMSKETIWVDSC